MEEIIYPKQRETKVIAISDGFYKPHNNETAYTDRVNKHINILNRDKQSLAHEMQSLMEQGQPIRHTGRRIEETYSFMRSMNGGRRQETFNAFADFHAKGTSFFTFDIETFGDSQERVGAYGISEISLNEFDMNGNRVAEGFNGVIRQDKDMVNALQGMINDVSKDPYAFNRLGGHHQRSIVDLMRYATIAPEGGTAFSSKGGIYHNSVIQEVFNTKLDTVDNAKVMANINKYLPFMQSGLNNMKKNGYTPKQAYKEINKIIQKNPDKYFMSFNGNSFDVPVLQAYGEKIGTPLANMKHLDYLALMNNSYNDLDDLKKEVAPGYQGGTYGKGKLASFVQAFGLDESQKDAHNATIDTDNTAKVVAMTKDKVAGRIENSKLPIKDGFNYFPTQMSWSQEPLKHGQRLYANNAIQAYGDDESFRMTLDGNGKWTPVSNDFDKNIINAKSFYQFAGYQQLENDSHAFRFFNDDTKEYSYIVRKGPNAYSELEDFVQSKFYNWNGLSNDQQHEIRLAAGVDKARRQYDRYFSVDGAGRGLAIQDGEVLERGTSGFSGLKRMLSNTALMDVYEQSSGKSYRDAVAAFREQGYSESEAKKLARNLQDGKKIPEVLDFNSQWDDKSKSFVLNEAERDKFFLMRGRLKDEMPYLNQAVNEIDKHFNAQIGEAKLLTGPQQTQALRQINQARDRALVNYRNELFKVAPNQTREVGLKDYEGKRLTYLDPEATTNDKYRSINFESPEAARNSIYGYARRGVDKDNPNKSRVMKERLDNMMQQLHAQGHISSNQLENYTSSIWNTGSPYIASGEIAMDMRLRNGGRYDTTRTEDVMNENQNIKRVTPAQNTAMIQQALNDLETANLMINMNTANGSEVKLSRQMQNAITILDETRFSGLKANNLEAVQDLLVGIKNASPSAHVALTMDTVDGRSTGQLKAFVYNKADSISVYNQLQSGATPSKAVSFHLPLLNQSGIHEVGNRSLIGHSYADYRNGTINKISSTQYIAKGYQEKMKSIMGAFHSGDIDKANSLASYALNDRLENMSGTRNEFSDNDTYKPAGTRADNLKESHVKVSNAMVQDLYYNGFYNGNETIKLTRDDFYDPDSVFNGDKLSPNATLDDVKMNSSHRVLMNMPAWAQQRLGEDVYTSGLKAEHVGKGVISTQDARNIVPYGTFYNHGRDNLVQYMNAYKISDGTKGRLNSIPGVSQDPLLHTADELAYNKSQIALGKVSADDIINGEAGVIRDGVGFNVKTAFMTQDQLHESVQRMMQDEGHLNMLKDIGIVKADGSIDQIRLPRLYEQQGIIAKDLSDALSVTNEKRYEKGLQFEANEALNKNEIKPGDVLGIKTHTNGFQEEIRYEGTSVARMVRDADDMILQWDSDPFKLMLDGEKMTDSPVDRRFIKALTGRDDVGIIMNPDVAKHMDYGMLMSGEARIFAQGVNQLTGEAQERAIRIIEDGGIGLKWDSNAKGFVDHSFNLEINRNAFQRVAEELQKTFEKVDFTTSIQNEILGDRVQLGILRAHQSKVSNYSKVVDGTGRRVIGYQEGFNPETGEYQSRRQYGGEDGVQWGHREMGVLKSYNMPETERFLYNSMHTKVRGDKAFLNPRLAESYALTQSIQNMMEDHAEVEGLHTSDFERLPEQYRNERTYRGTVFSDRETLVQQLSNRYEGEDLNRKLQAISDHGYYMQLPGANGQPVVNIDGENKRALDKIFIPFTAVEGAQGETHLRELQRKISNIYNRAAEVNSAPNYDKAVGAQKGLQRAVDDYIGQAYKELTSSDGMLFKDGFKTTMNNSASGLFKLMDFETSQAYEEKWGKGQYTVISEQTAKKMGVYDKLAAGDELFTANVRYPTFHDGAMQFTKLRMDAGVKEGEFHTTSFASMLQNADSDGDYSHIVVADDQAVQEEWRRAHDRTQSKFETKWQSHLDDAEKKSLTGVSLDRTETPAKRLNTENLERVAEDNLPKSLANSNEETAAKIGKMTIGRASNLNLFLRQIADNQFANDTNTNNMIKSFGAGLEQKLIDAKHGAEPVGLKMIDAIYAGKWDEALNMDDRYFGGNFTEEFHMKQMAEILPPALERTSAGLRSRELKFGTSTGLSYSGATDNHGLTNLVDMLYGRNTPDGDNKALNMFRKFLQEDYGVEMDMGQSSVPDPIERQFQAHTMEAVQKGKLSMDAARNKVGEVARGTGERLRGVWENMKGMSGKNKALIGGGLAVAGIAGYNILNTDMPERHYNNEPQMPETQSAGARVVQPALQMPSEDYSMQNASISIQASGSGVNRDALSASINQGMRDVGMQAGPTRMTVNHNDNTSQLNRQWYRDKVRENM